MPLSLDSTYRTILAAARQRRFVSYGELAKAKIKVRRALLYYALRRLGLDTDPAARRPQEQQIVLLSPRDLAGNSIQNGGGQY